eukprot:sb/3473777/
MTKIYDSKEEHVIRIQIDMEARKRSSSMDIVKRRCGSMDSNPPSPSTSTPSWARGILNRETENTSCPIHVVVFSRGMVLGHKYTDLAKQPLLITSGEEIDLSTMTAETVQKNYGRGANNAEHFYIPLVMRFKRLDLRFLEIQDLSY